MADAAQHWEDSKKPRLDDGTGLSAEIKALVQEQVNAVLAAQKPRSKFLLIAHPSMSRVKNKLLEGYPGCYEEVKVTWKEFADGMPNVFIESVHKLGTAHVVLLLNLRNKEILLDQISMLYAIPRYGCKALTVLLPFYPTGTMERIDKEGEVATAATLSRILSATPMTPDGPVRFMIFDIHALQIRFYFQDTILPVLLSAMPLLTNLLRTRHVGESMAVCFPDEGARKRFGNFFSSAGYPVLCCSKVREGDKRVVKITEGEAKGHHVVIVDDLCNTGGTVIACRQALVDFGAAKVSVFVTHGVFPEGSWQKFTNAGFERIYITDSIPETCDVFEEHKTSSGSSVFEVTSLAPAIHTYLLAIEGGKDVLDVRL